MGLSGKVKITNPDILQNNNAPFALSITRTPSDDNIPLSSIPSSNASAKRFIQFCNDEDVGHFYLITHFVILDFVIRTSTMGSNSHPGTATRSLPEIPVDAAKDTSALAVDSRTSNFVSYVGDTSSDLYATLEEHKISNFSTISDTFSFLSELLRNMLIFNSIIVNETETFR